MYDPSGPCPMTFRPLTRGLNPPALVAELDEHKKPLEREREREKNKEERKKEREERGGGKKKRHEEERRGACQARRK